ncbi:MAG: FAD/NAD-binding family oxidoreductase [Desulfohalobiaceae bacterium]|nr:FAD/NAD-binding family oxidoreductase [Desulfohalobiaceae bacterium]
MGKKVSDTCEVIKTRPENYDVTSIIFEKPEDWRVVDWKPGQYGIIRVYRDGQWSEPHPFTLSCSPTEENLRMTIKQQGNFTSTIPELKSGDKIKFSGPYGKFCQDIEEHDDIVMIAGGVGITPFLSVLRHFLSTGASNRVTLFWANKTLDDVFAEEELKTMTAELNLDIIHVLSREKEENIPEDGVSGSIRYTTGHISRELLDEYIRVSSSAVYLCGPPGMQEHVLNELQACGVKPESVQRETFSFPKT